MDQTSMLISLGGGILHLVACQTFAREELRFITLLAELLKISPETPDPATIRYAAEIIRRGELVAIPTDTFYGIAADPFNLMAVEQIYRVKGRPETRALPILVNTIPQAVSLARDVP